MNFGLVFVIFLIVLDSKVKFTRSLMQERKQDTVQWLHLLSIKSVKVDH